MNLQSYFPSRSLVPLAPFVVDFFKLRPSALPRGDGNDEVPELHFFLTHFHADHYGGLDANWPSDWKIYASALTIELCILNFDLPRSVFVELRKDSSTEVVVQSADPQTARWKVHVIDANHCPGAVIVFFENVHTKRKYIHTGDMRYTPRMKEEAILQAYRGGTTDVLYLDTTYANPKYRFAPQDVSVSYVAEEIAKSHEENQRLAGGRMLILVATYVIGKEKILMSIADTLRCKIFAQTERKRRILALVLGERIHDDRKVKDLITDDPDETPLHVLRWGAMGENWPFFRPDWQFISDYLLKHRGDTAVGFIPTGWMGTGSEKTTKFRTMDNATKTVRLHLVPYSEHSTYLELCDFVKFVKPKRIEPTVVGGGGSTRSLTVEQKREREAERERHRLKMIELFHSFVDNQDAKKNFIMAITKTPDAEKAADAVEVVDMPGSPDAAKADTGSEENPLVKQMLEVVGHQALSAAEAKRIIEEANNDLSQALGRFFDGQTQALRSAAPEKPIPATPTPKPRARTSPGKKRRRGQQQTLLAWARPKSSEDEQTPSKRRKAAASTICGASWQETRQGEMPEAANTAAGTEETIRQEIVVEDTEVEEAKVEDIEVKETKVEETKVDEGMADEASAGVTTAAEKMTEEATSLEPALARQRTSRSDAPCPVFFGSMKPAAASESDQGHASKKRRKGETEATAAAAEKATLTKPAAEYDPVEDYPFAEESVKAKLRDDRAPEDAARIRKPAPYLFLSMLCEGLEAESGYIKKAELLINYFRTLYLHHPGDLLPSVYLLTNHIAPANEGVELNIGGGVVSAAISEVTGTPRSRLREMYRDLGDLGDVAQACRQTQTLLLRPKALTIRHVFTSLRGLSTVSGSGSAIRRKAVLIGLLRACRQSETRTLTRTFIQHLRTGAVLKTVLANLSKAVCLTQVFGHRRIGVRDYTKSKRLLQAAADAFAEAYSMCPNLEVCIPKLLEQREWVVGPEKDAVMDLKLGLSLQVGMPLKPMLAKMQSTYEALFKSFGTRPFLCEYKYDGMRAQVHIGRAEGASVEMRTVRIFSRNSEDNTERFPEVVECMRSAVPADTEAIFDAEVVAVDRKTTPPALLPFQSLARRPRGRNAGRAPVAEKPTAVCLFLFDILLLNGENLLKRSLRDRRKILRKPSVLVTKAGVVEYAEAMEYAAKSTEAELQPEGKKQEEKEIGKEDAVQSETAKKHASRIEEAKAEAAEAETAKTDDQVLVEAMFRSIERGCEGLMCKLLDGPASAYEPSRRSDSWLKLKKDYIEGIADSLDLVPIGAWYGNGRKAGWYSPFLLAVYDPATDTFQSVCRVLSGFTDEFYTKKTFFYCGKVLEGKRKAAAGKAEAEGEDEDAEATGSQEVAESRLLPRKPPNYVTNEMCPVWFDACEVWTIRGAEFSLSLTHMCAQGRIPSARTRGLALRFPRFLNERPDKRTEEATTPDQIVELYSKQNGAEDVHKGVGAADDDDDEDIL
mmetsp:Transcript_10741/g.40352  ORF Transcript_10741/g.40352 Transcript_10741/m.40352 type:complete len:1482 (-) Transcript_10741:96-4541(-)